MTFKPEDIDFVDIFPPIGIARVGDSDEWYVGPEVPGVGPIPDGGFKDSQHRIKKQAARFRVYAFDKDSKPLGEINNNDYTLTWTAHVANKKSSWVRFRGRVAEEQMSEERKYILRNPDIQGWPEGAKKDYKFTDTRDRLIIDSGDVSVQGASAGPVALKGEINMGKNAPKEVHLGDIHTDDHGRLIMVAGSGDSFSTGANPYPELTDGFDNDGWVDSICDGNVQVVVKSKLSPALEFRSRNKSTIITAPPKFAHGVHCFTTLFDLIEDVYERQNRKEGYEVGEVEFYRHIGPMFRNMYGLSWTNPEANTKHGPNHDKYFLNPKLADPTAGNQARKKIFERMRLFVRNGDKNNYEARKKQPDDDGQSIDWYMPLLSGDAGDTHDKDGNIRTDPNYWASVTELQYDRMKKWSEGKFKTGEPEVQPSSFDEIPLEKQPEALTHAALEWATGAALYPGIEVYWIAQFDHMYKLDTKYRIADAVKPGDLSRGLSLPWQSDFFECYGDWWPSARPDKVVTEKYFKEISAVTPPEDLAGKLTTREFWDRNLRAGKEEGTDAMVQKWTKLGFVAPLPYGSDPDKKYPPIFVEGERLLPEE